MHFDDLLTVMRDEFALAATDTDDALMAWLVDDPTQAAGHATPLAADLDRLAQTARVIALDGLATALEQVRDSALALSMLDAETMGQGLSWLIGWREPFEACFSTPGDAATSDALLAYLSNGPLAPSANDAAELRRLLTAPPELPADAASEAQAVPAATDDDVDLAVPDDVDPDLYETFLNDSPQHIARLGDAVRALARGGLSAAQITEAQRVAHTFKGSGNIVGIKGVGRLAHRIEDLIEFAAEHGGQLPAPMAHDLEQATATLDQMLFALRGEEAMPSHALAHLQALIDWVNAIRDDTWEQRAAELGARTPSRATPLADAAVVPAATTNYRPGTDQLSQDPSHDLSQNLSNSASTKQVAVVEAADAEAQLRVGVTRMDRLVRRAGQGLVQSGRLNEHLRTLEDRLGALDANNALMQARLRELQVALERQGVTLQEKGQADGGVFDSLELDRYNQLHTLSHFVAELVADEHQLTRAARDEAAKSVVALREHDRALKDQHRELLGARLVPFRNIVSRLRRTVSQTANSLGRSVRLDVDGDHIQLDSDVLERLTEPLLHLLRNAVDHGIEPADERVLYGKPDEGVIHLSCRRDGQTVRVECRDDGRGLDLHAVEARAIELGLIAPGDQPTADAVARMILLPGFSTRDEVTETSGRGVGMDVVADRVRAMKGQVHIATVALTGTTFTLRVPATTGSVHALIVEAGGERLALPTDTVQAAIAAGQGELREGRFHYKDHHYRVASLADWVGLAETTHSAAIAADSGADSAVDIDLDSAATSTATTRPMVLVRGANETVALAVDQVVDARELILQDIGVLLRRARGISGGALQPDGRVLFVVDSEQLDLATQSHVGQAAAAALRRRASVQRKRVLVVDDAISVRNAVSQLVSDAGYEVLTARDGFDALQRLKTERVDIVLTDLEMPNLNGLDLTRQLRLRAELQTMPIVMITSRATDKHRQAAFDAGVNLYLTKPYTDGDLLAHVRELLAA